MDIDNPSFSTTSFMEIIRLTSYSMQEGRNNFLPFLVGAGPAQGVAPAGFNRDQTSVACS